MQGTTHTWRFWAVLAGVYAVLVALPHLLSFSQKEVAVFLVINVLVVASYRLLTLTGEWSLAHVVIMGAGAYASTLLAKRLGVPVPPAMLLGAGVAALTAWVLSFPLLRMKAFYFLIGSFAAGEIIRLCWKRFREPFGGPKGLKLIPSVPDIELGGFQVMFFNPVNYYYLCLIVVSISLVILYRLERSRIGLTFHAIHWQDRLAESVGVDTRRYRTLAFVIASFFAGLAGALLAHYLGTVNPNQFDVESMVYVLVWVIVGGRPRSTARSSAWWCSPSSTRLCCASWVWTRRGRSSMARFWLRPSCSFPTGSKRGTEVETSVRSRSGATTCPR